MRVVTIKKKPGSSPPPARALQRAPPRLGSSRDPVLVVVPWRGRPSRRPRRRPSVVTFSDKRPPERPSPRGRSSHPGRAVASYPASAETSRVSSLAKALSGDAEWQPGARAWARRSPCASSRTTRLCTHLRSCCTSGVAQRHSRRVGRRARTLGRAQGVRGAQGRCRRSSVKRLQMAG